MSTSPRWEYASLEGGVENTLESFPMQQAIVRASYTSDEVTAVCPVTGQPDFYTVRVHLTPLDESPRETLHGLESKSLKLYLQSYRDVGVMCETLAHLVAEDAHLATGAQVAVVVTQKPRGGVEIHAHAEAPRV